MADSIKFALSKFGLSKDCMCTAISVGLINNTYLILDPFDGNKYILQQLNKSVFPNVESLMSNIQLVSDYLKTIYKCQFPRLLTTLNGQNFLTDEQDKSWRIFEYIEQSKTIDQTSSCDVAFEAGNIIGRFHFNMRGFDPKKLYTTIPDFHSLSLRLTQLNAALSNSSYSKHEPVLILISRIDGLKEKFDSLLNLDLPLRVTHNDTKLNNILFDENNKAICLVDLDTLMPGNLHTDYGDALRTLASSVSENEPDTDKVHFNFDLFESFTEGFLSKVGTLLSNTEKNALPLSIPFMPFIMSIRFLTDFLNGNIYYKVTYENQNLDRAKNQMTLVDDTFNQYSSIEKSLLNKY